MNSIATELRIWAIIYVYMQYIFSNRLLWF